MVWEQRPVRGVKKVRFVSPKKQLDDLWSEIVKTRAHFVSEISGKTTKLQAHHIVHKPNHRLRYELENGICITSGEHRFGVHGPSAIDFQDKIIGIIGTARWEWLKQLRGFPAKIDVVATRLYLEQELEKARGEHERWLKKGVNATP